MAHIQSQISIQHVELINVETTEKLKICYKICNASFHSLLLTSVAKTIGADIWVSSIVSCRNHFEGNNCTGTFVVPIVSKATFDNANVKQSIKDNFIALKNETENAHKYYNAFYRVFDVLDICLKSKYLQSSILNVSISNMGNIELGSYESFSATLTSCTQIVMLYSPIIYINVFTTSEGLHISFNGNYPYITQTYLDNFAKLFIQSLTSLYPNVDDNIK